MADYTAAVGVIVDLDENGEFGTIRDANGALHEFRRQGLTHWMDFLEMRPGVRVRFEFASAGSAFNVEIDRAA